MLEARIKIEKELAIRGFRRAQRYSSFREIAYFYAVQLIIVWIVIATANAVRGQQQLTTFHLQVLIILWIIASIYRYICWYMEVAAKTVGWEFDATLNDEGVTTRYTVDNYGEAIYKWNHYANYVEYDDYLQITDVDGNITFLPKTHSLERVIEFTKSKILIR